MALITTTQVAASTPYDNTSSGLPATDVQTAIDELAAAGSTIPELTTDPASPTSGETWVLRESLIGSPIGLLLALTNAQTTYALSYKTVEGAIVRVRLT